MILAKGCSLLGTRPFVGDYLTKECKPEPASRTGRFVEGFGIGDVMFRQTQHDIREIKLTK
jgi:hypothetical protein